MCFVQSVWPDSWSSLCDTGDQAELHWLQPSGYRTQPLATQWLTQRLIGVLKASYLTHQNNKYCYQAGPSRASFLCCPRMPLISSLLLVGLSQTAYAPHSPCNTPLCFWCYPDSQTGCNWEGGYTVAHVLVGRKKAFKIIKSASILQPPGGCKKTHIFFPTSTPSKRLTDENKSLCCISLNPALSPDYIPISASILLPLLLLVVKQAW